MRHRTSQLSQPQALAWKERFILIALMATVAAAAWIYIAHLAWEMDHMAAAPDMFMPHAGPWRLSEFLLLYVMWAVMMVAMMLPSALPMVLMFAATGRRRRTQGRQFTTTSLFLSGYFLVWFAFSVLASAVQWALHQAAVLTPMMTPRTSWLGGVVLLMAGLYQWTSLKKSCLRHCSSPLSFIMGHWRSGQWGALRMGIEHGMYCTGCCWALMALLFAIGVMNVLWVAAIAAFVLIEKVFPRRELIAKASGAVLAALGLYVLAAPQSPLH